jgi:hypothetical protein
MRAKNFPNYNDDLADDAISAADGMILALVPGASSFEGSPPTTPNNIVLAANMFALADIIDTLFVAADGNRNQTAQAFENRAMKLLKPYI